MLVRILAEVDEDAVFGVGNDGAVLVVVHFEEVWLGVQRRL